MIVACRNHLWNSAAFNGPKCAYAEWNDYLTQVLCRVLLFMRAHQPPVYLCKWWMCTNVHTDHLHTYTGGAHGWHAQMCTQVVCAEIQPKNLVSFLHGHWSEVTLFWIQSGLQFLWGDSNSNSFLLGVFRSHCLGNYMWISLQTSAKSIAMTHSFINFGFQSTTLHLKQSTIN